MDMIAPLVLIGSSSVLPVTRTDIKSQTSLILGKIRLFASELRAHEHPDFSHRPGQVQITR